MHVEANRAAWIEIDLNCIDYNIKEIINKVGDASKIMGVIKSDAYGHGAVKIAKLLSDNGIHSFAVATLPEAMELRKAGFYQRGTGAVLSGSGFTDRNNR